MNEVKKDILVNLIERLPKHEWDKIVIEVEKAYSHKTIKVELDSPSCELIKKSLS
ncbi:MULTISPECIES: hypothetical protein [Staphylococcus]|uniref:hypothetical protein n=1 Tax=Staphylococcus TaxID=1279 RepID=UPI00159F21B5|nr:hypothetical protein [Staphylococcus equorum]MDK9845192.1 hypothetical protein [Staphylococcus equorum]MDK9849121.1 hypothetical protein [Staphylococcus equorum]MDK9854428.1 hypothetical protein [Staphylococcus equorum]